MTEEEDIASLAPSEVLVAGGHTRRSRGTGKFHTRACGFHPDNATPMKRSMAEAWGYEECDYCAAPDKTYAGDNDYTYLQAAKNADPDDIPST